MGKVRDRRFFIKNAMHNIILTSQMKDSNSPHQNVSGDLDGTSSDNESPCEWILETSPGKVGLCLGNKSNQIIWQQILNQIFQGIEIAISELSGPTDCSSDYLEVRGRNHF